MTPLRETTPCPVLQRTSGRGYSHAPVTYPYPHSSSGTACLTFVRLATLVSGHQVESGGPRSMSRRRQESSQHREATAAALVVTGDNTTVFGVGFASPDTAAGHKGEPRIRCSVFSILVGTIVPSRGAYAVAFWLPNPQCKCTCCQNFI